MTRSPAHLLPDHEGRLNVYCWCHTAVVDVPACLCWCQVAVVHAPAEQVRTGQTVTCGRPRCQPPDHTHRPDPQRTRGRPRVDCACGWRGISAGTYGRTYAGWLTHWQEAG